MNTPATSTGLAHAELDAVEALTALDRAWVNFLCQQMPTSHATHLWLAALTSHQWGRGHACLDIEALQSNAAGLLKLFSPSPSRMAAWSE